MFVGWNNSEMSDGSVHANLTLDEGLGAEVDVLFIVYVPARGVKTKKKILQTRTIHLITTIRIKSLSDAHEFFLQLFI
jgi:hypothetical protein